MREYITIPGELTNADVEALVKQLSEIRLPDGRKPFTVEIYPNGANHGINLKNECCTGVILFRKAPKWREE